MKILLLSILISTLMLCSIIPAYPSWIEYTNVRYLDLDGDLVEEIIIESRHGVGTGHYIEERRILKIKSTE